MPGVAETIALVLEGARHAPEPEIGVVVPFGAELSVAVDVDLEVPVVDHTRDPEGIADLMRRRRVCDDLRDQRRRKGDPDRVELRIVRVGRDLADLDGL